MGRSGYSVYIVFVYSFIRRRARESCFFGYNVPLFFVGLDSFFLSYGCTEACDVSVVKPN